MSGRLMAIALGALTGEEKKKDRERQHQLEDLQTLEQLGNSTGFSLAPDTPNPAAPVAAPPAPAPSSVFDVVRDPNGIGGVDEPAPKPAAPPAAAKPAASPLSVAHITLGGRDRTVNYDPSQSPAAKRVAREAANTAAHQSLSAIDDTIGVYDPSNDYVDELRKYNKRKQVATALVKTGEFTQDEADLYAKTGEDLAEHGRKKALTEAEIKQKSEPKAPTPGTPAYYEMVRRVAEIRAAHSKGGANADPVKAKEKWVRSRMVQLMKSPGKDPDLGNALPGLSKEEAISQASDEWDSVVSDATDEPAASTSTAAPKRAPAPAEGGNSAKIKTLNAQYHAALSRGVDEDAAWTTYQRELAKIKAAGSGRASGQ